MAFKDILVALTSYPDPTPVSVVDDAVSIAAVLGSHLAALSFETRVQVPGHFLSNSLVEGMITTETDKSRKNARDLLAAFDAATEKSGILHEAILEKCITLDVPHILVEYARLRDLTILSVPGVGFQPRRGARDSGRAAHSRSGQEGSRRNGYQGEDPGYQTFR